MKTNDYRTAQRNALYVVDGLMRSGKLPRLARENIPCVDCGKRAVHYDHRDYGKPESVEPVCQSCNCRRGKAVFTKTENKTEKIYFTCKKCGYEWVARTDKPRKCPNCQSRDWQGKNGGK